MIPGICWILRGIARTIFDSPGTLTPANFTGSNSIQTPVQFVT